MNYAQVNLQKKTFKKFTGTLIIVEKCLFKNEKQNPGLMKNTKSNKPTKSSSKFNKEPSTSNLIEYKL